MPLPYIIEVLTCATRRYLSDVRTAAQVDAMIDAVIATPPHVEFRSESYHYRQTRTGNGKLSSREKVVTSRDYASLYLTGWRDASGTPEQLKARWRAARSAAGGGVGTSLVKIRFSKALAFADDATAYAYERQRQDFRIRSHRDMNQVVFSDTTPRIFEAPRW